jgi:hypothetical protein
MYSYIPVIIFIFVLIAIPVISIVLLRTYQAKQIQKAREEWAEIERRIEAGQLAAATIVSARAQSNREVAGTVVVRVVLRVEQPGGATYTAAVNWDVDSVMDNALKPGQPIAVKIDPEDPKRIYPNVSWASYSMSGQ